MDNLHIGSPNQATDQATDQVHQSFESPFDTRTLITHIILLRTQIPDISPCIFKKPVPIPVHENFYTVKFQFYHGHNAHRRVCRSVECHLERTFVYESIPIIPYRKKKVPKPINGDTLALEAGRWTMSILYPNFNEYHEEIELNNLTVSELCLQVCHVFARMYHVERSYCTKSQCLITSRGCICEPAVRPIVCNDQEYKDQEYNDEECKTPTDESKYECDEEDAEEDTEENNDEDNDEDATCSICFNNISVHDGVILQCNHIYHAECIKEWCKTKLSCPMCRSGIQCKLCNGSKEYITRSFKKCYPSVHTLHPRHEFYETNGRHILRNIPLASLSIVEIQVDTINHIIRPIVSDGVYDDDYNLYIYEQYLHYS